MAEKVFRQRDRLSCGGLPPVGKLRGNDDHLLVVLLGLDPVVFRPDVHADALKMQALITGEGHKQRIGFCPVVVVRNVQAEVYISVVLTVQDIVEGKAADYFRSEIDLIRWQNSPCFLRSSRFFRCGVSYSKFRPRTHSLIEFSAAFSEKR